MELHCIIAAEELHTSLQPDALNQAPHPINTLLITAQCMACWLTFILPTCSKHPAAAVHAAARAVSGAAVYVSDSPGKHDFDILRQLVLPDGSVLRGLLPGRPTLDCLFVDPLRDAQSLLKVCTHCMAVVARYCKAVILTAVFAQSISANWQA